METAALAPARRRTDDRRRAAVQELGAWRPESAVPLERVRRGGGGGRAGPDEWALRARVWRPAQLRFKLVEWIPAASAVAAWEAGPDRLALLDDGAGPPQLEPPDTTVRL